MTSGEKPHGVAESKGKLANRRAASTNYGLRAHRDGPEKNSNEAAGAQKAIHALCARGQAVDLKHLHIQRDAGRLGAPACATQQARCEDMNLGALFYLLVKDGMNIR